MRGTVSPTLQNQAFAVVRERAVQVMVAAVRKGGVVLLHMLNLWRLPDGPCHWQKCKRAIWNVEAS